MRLTIEVDIDEQGRVRPVDHSVAIPTGRALLTVVTLEADDGALLSEQALAKDWLRPEEEDSWEHLRPES